MNLSELFLGQIPEAIYFALFMIFTKEFKSKRLCFLVLTTLEYILLLNVFPYSMWSHILFFFITYTLLMILYKDKCRITDIFTLGIASLILTIISIAVFIICDIFTDSMMLGNIIQKVCLFIALFNIRHKLPKIEKLYHRLWNRSKIKYFMKSTTFRAINVIVFNLMFYMINICMIFILLKKGG